MLEEFNFGWCSVLWADAAPLVRMLLSVLDVEQMSHTQRRVSYLEGCGVQTV